MLATLLSVSREFPTLPPFVTKHDGYRLIARRDGNRVRLFTRRGYDWSAKYPWIVEALRSLRVRSIIVDGESLGWKGTSFRRSWSFHPTEFALQGDPPSAIIC
jgi:ATP-dependent DNA ligase